MAVDDVFRLTIETRYVDAPITINNVLWFVERLNQGDNGEALALDFRTSSVLNALRAFQTNRLTYERIRVQRMFPSPFPPVVSIYAGGVVGTSGGTNVGVPFAAVVGRLTASVPGRSNTGRLFWGGFDSRMVDTNPVSGLWEVSHVNAGPQSTQLAILARYNPADVLSKWAWIIWSRKKLSFFHPGDPVPYVPVDAVQCDTVMRLQRSREWGVSRRHAGHH